MRRFVPSLFKTKIGIYVDKHSLHAEYKQIMKDVHPDKWKSSSENERLTSDINTFYYMIKNDVKRCTYLLEEKGYSLHNNMPHFTIDNPILEECLFIGEELETMTEHKELTGLLSRVQEQKKISMDTMHTEWTNGRYGSCLPYLHNLSYLDTLEGRISRKIL